MDLLDSIMSKMVKPPSVNDKQRQLMKEQQKAMEEVRNKEREELSKFRTTIEGRIESFIQDSKAEKLRLEPMDQVARSIIRDVADVAGLTSYTFGVEGEDRHIMLFKKDYPLDERELQAYRNGEEWNLEEAEKMAARRAEQRRQDEFRLHLFEQQRRQQNQRVGAGGLQGPKFLEKIDRLVGGRQTGKQAAKSMVVDNKTFGFVRSELKKDKRTIEETLNDIRAKRQKRDPIPTASDETEDAETTTTLTD